MMRNDQPEIGIRSREVPMGLPGLNRRVVDGYVLENGTVLLESERDRQGRYFGGAGLDGIYLRTPHLFTPVTDESGEIRAFREIPAGKPEKILHSGEPER